MNVQQDRYPLIELRRYLTAPWELRINPDGTRTLLARPGLPLTDSVAELLNDLRAARSCRCDDQLGPADLAPGATCTALLLRPASTAGRQVRRPDHGTNAPGEIVQPRTAADDERPSGFCA
ncbi:hypothetical protein JOF53_007998 [Crossiella equi]|uniref:TubC N-terminal docking domain-containing protein n=1 Tax=Crossiella equi TaxID=130796 RepID=A0ABS5ARE9_9PSEU|nr:hypothetical protein [Crossiella equi]MBP2479126.1 hypothetical protein [Crossiella equi]